MKSGPENIESVIDIKMMLNEGQKQNTPHSISRNSELPQIKSLEGSGNQNTQTRPSCAATGLLFSILVLLISVILEGFDSIFPV
jgi:hypothetical protein